MANYVSNHIYITGSKQAIVDFLNKGLKNDHVKERLSMNMSGEEIVAFINGLEPSLSMGSFFPRPKTFDTYDTTNEMKSFKRWYLDGCTANQDSGDDAQRNARYDELLHYIESFPEEFQADEQGHYGWYQLGKAIEILYPGTNAAYVKYMKGYYQAKYYQKKKYGVVGWYDWNKATYGCKWNCAFGIWKCEKDKEDTLCLSVGMSTPWSPAYKFVENLNKFDGITVYAYAWGDMNWPFFFWYNGRREEGDAMEPRENERYEERKKEIDAAYEQSLAEAQTEEERDQAKNEWQNAMCDLDDEMLDEKWEQFKKELNEEIG